MSGTAMSKPTNESCRLSLGRGDRFITNQGKPVETINPYIVASPGARRVPLVTTPPWPEKALPTHAASAND
jgi:hypothetical protein